MSWTPRKVKDDQYSSPTVTSWKNGHLCLFSFYLFNRIKYNSNCSLNHHNKHAYGQTESEKINTTINLVTSWGIIFQCCQMETCPSLLTFLVKKKSLSGIIEIKNYVICWHSLFDRLYKTLNVHWKATIYLFERFGWYVLSFDKKSYHQRDINNIYF